MFASPIPMRPMGDSSLPVRDGPKTQLEDSKQPVTSNKTEEGEAKNRRVELVEN